MSGYIDALKGFSVSKRRAYCKHCGTTTPILYRRGICSNCELPIYAQQKSTKDTDLKQGLTQYESELESENYPAAINIYDQIISIYNHPSYLYVQGINYVKYSNFMLKLIRYDRDGFMDINASYKKASNELYYQAKLFFNKAIFQADKEINKEHNDNELHYVSLLSYLKIGNLRGAQEMSEQLCIANEDSLYTYSNVLIKYYLKDSSIIQDVDIILKGEDYPITIFYYLSRTLFLKSKNKIALQIINQVEKYISNKSILALSKQITSYV